MIVNALTKHLLSYILSSKEVIDAKNQLSSSGNNSVAFTLSLPLGPVGVGVDVCEELNALFGLHLPSDSAIPMRWIKGDTKPHVDRAQTHFTHTYLIYITSSDGQFLIDGVAYPIVQNSAFTFEEGTTHETINTGVEPRLLLGPMNELCVAVGGGSFLSYPGGTIVYIRDNSGSIEYSTDQSSWNSISWPVTVFNNDTSQGYLQLLFTTDITISGTYDYFACGSEYIQFGDISANRPTIYVTATNYIGLIMNGDQSTNGYNYVRVYNLIVDGSGGPLQAGYVNDEGAGWIGHKVSPIITQVCSSSYLEGLQLKEYVL